jgi:mediator of RNA polymerase II transcription subunit 16
VKNDKEYRYESAQASCFGPCHPDPRKSALICLTTSGDLRLIFPQSDGKWYHISSEIESVVSSNDLITHAAICVDKSMTILEPVNSWPG